MGTDPKGDVALARRVRALAPDAFLWADANGGYEPEVALDTAPRLADAGVDVLEAPCRPNRIAAYQGLVRQGALPILMDEGVVSPVEFREFLRLGMLDGVAMKPSRCGGLLPARKQIELLGEAGKIWLGSGLTDPDLSLAASLPTEPLKVRDGALPVPGGPGLGVTVDEERLQDRDDRGRTDQEGTNGRQALWVDDSNTVAGASEGVAVFVPDDGRPRSWLTREYGTFGPRRPDPRNGTGFTLRQGEVLSGHVGILVHRGDAETGRAAKRYREWLRLFPGATGPKPPPKSDG